MCSSRRLGAVALVLLVSVVGCSGGFEKMPDADVDAAQREAAQRIGNKLWLACGTGQHESLRDDEAIKEMQAALSPEKMRSTCATTRAQFGDFSAMDYAETWKPKSGALRVYRFKGRFSNAASPPEIRVVMEGTKLSGLWIKAWSDTLR